MLVDLRSKDNTEVKFFIDVVNCFNNCKLICRETSAALKTELNFAIPPNKLLLSKYILNVK